MPLDPLGVACPHCGAEAGHGCRGSKGKPCPPHARRKKAVDPQAEHWRQARLKTERETRQALEEAPLFADETRVELRSVEDNYWRTRFQVAARMEGYVPRAHFHEDVATLWMRQAARRLMPADTFAYLDGKNWTGPKDLFWRDVLLGRKRIVVAWDRLVYYGPFRTELSPGNYWYHADRVELREIAVWPPPGWQAPFTAAALDALLACPPPADHPGAVDPLGLATAAAASP